MKIGFMGLGKLGLPCALAAEAHGGHEVVGYDPDPKVKRILATKILPYKEVGAEELLEDSKIEIVSVEAMVESCDIIFVPIQTPHAPEYEGITRIPNERVNFDYSFLQNGLDQISAAVHVTGRKGLIVSIISTVLPTTFDNHLRGFIHEDIRIAYNPHFIAMGTTIPDYLAPEFVLLGVDDEEAAETVEAYYRTLHQAPVHRCTIKSAELVKVAYNTFISMKISFVNVLMEICHHTGADVDQVTDGLKKADQRLLSPRYLTAGMGDGGGCHPRDNIALSWLSEHLGLSFDLFEAIMMQREAGTDFLADLIEDELIVRKESPTESRKFCPTTPVIICGAAFKPETNLVTGSPSILLGNILEERSIPVSYWDPHVKAFREPISDGKPRVYFIGTKHPEFVELQVPPHSVVIDPHRMVTVDDPTVQVIRIGEGRG